MSMKVAASDFDGTIFRGETISAEDLSSIRRWRASGNKFGIVTGRCYPMLAHHLEEFDLEVDFSICDNGAIIFDGRGRIISEAELSKKILLEITKEPSAIKSYHFALEAAEKVYCANVKPGSWVIKEQKRWKFPLEVVEVAQIEKLPAINQLALDFSTPEEALATAAALNEKFSAQIHAQKNTHSVDVVPKGINKAQGVENLLKLCGWHGAEVFFIGDEANDLPGIKKFGGFTVETAKEFVKREARAIFSSVGAMLNHFGD